MSWISKDHTMSPTISNDERRSLFSMYRLIYRTNFCKSRIYLVRRGQSQRYRTLRATSLASTTALRFIARMYLPSSDALAKIFLEQRTTAKSDSESSLGSKRNAPDVMCLSPDGKRIPESEPPTKKKHAGYRHISLPQPGVPYQVLCGKAGYVPVIVLFPGCSEGPFSVENTELLSVEECCRYDRQTNTLSCQKTTGICHPVQNLDIENPAHREVQWVEPASLKPLDQRAVLPLHYERVLAYLQKYGHPTIGTQVTYTSFAQSALVERSQKGVEDTSHGVGEEPCTMIRSSCLYHIPCALQSSHTTNSRFAQ